MKAKREFYLYGNDRKFADEHLISTMTGEPMPKKWQRFIELTPEEKARWDASLRLDTEYRLAEEQGFPNGIPGGRMRGSALYTITQMEEEHERELQKKRMEEAREQYEQSFIPYKTEIQYNTNGAIGNIEPTKQLWQNPFDIWKNNLNPSISALSVPLTEKEPAFDVDQAIQNLTEKVRYMMNRENQQMQTNKMASDDSFAIGMPRNDLNKHTLYDEQQVNNNYSATQALVQKKENPPQTFAEDKKEAQGYTPWTGSAIYAESDEPTPQTYSLQSKMAAYGIRPQNAKTAISSGGKQRTVIKHSDQKIQESDLAQRNMNRREPESVQHRTASQVMNLLNGETVSLAVATKDYGYGNGDIYSEESYSIDEMRRDVESIVISIAEEAMNNLVGLADTILDVVLTVWRFGRVTNLVLGTASLVIGICYVAVQTQKKWESEKAQVLAEYKPEDEAGRKNAAARRVAEIFMENAMAYFLGEWAGYIAEKAKESSKWRLFAKWGVGTFLDCLKKETPPVTSQDITDWQEHIMRRLLF